MHRIVPKPSPVSYEGIDHDEEDEHIPSPSLEKSSRSESQHSFQATLSESDNIEPELPQVHETEDFRDILSNEQHEEAGNARTPSSPNRNSESFSGIDTPGVNNIPLKHECTSETFSPSVEEQPITATNDKGVDETSSAKDNAQKLYPEESDQSEFQTTECDARNIGERSFDAETCEGSSEEENDIYHDMNSLCSQSKLDRFMSRYSYLVGFALKHNTVTRSMMDDLLVQHNAEYKSWNGVRGALLRWSGLAISELPYCREGHEALQVNDDGSYSLCTHPKCDEAAPNVSNYTYIGIWERLKARMKSSTEGPRLFTYMKQGLEKLREYEENGEYVDFFTGELFKEALEALGGIKSVQNDIFLSFSTDGVSTFKSVEYSYWPCVVFILNLPPSERFQVRNVMPVSVIPGPKSPSNLVSFLSPMLEELSELSGGKLVELWNGKEVIVRVHLLYVLSDLPALHKLCNLRGHNALVPCRYCTITGVYSKKHNHVYFPSVVRETGNHRPKTLWDIRRLPLRSEATFLSQLREISNSSQHLSNTEVRERCKAIGVTKPILSEVIARSKLVVAFRSFPIDLMHLLFENVAPHVMSIWCGDVHSSSGVAFLRSAKVKEEVNKRMLSAGRSFSSKIRRPRALDEKARWKATEWKAFVIELSLVVLDGLVPKKILSGWRTFVNLCEKLCQWKLTEADLEEIHRLSCKFFVHFEETYYQTREENLNLCRYTNHLLLHTASSIRDCGPLSLVSQWAIENYVGSQNRGCNATNLFGESVLESLKFRESALMYSIISRVSIPLLDEEQSERSALLHRDPMVHGRVFRHPKRTITMSEMKRRLNINLKKLLRDYYIRSQGKDIPESEFHDDRQIVCWRRLIVDQCENGYATTFVGCKEVTGIPNRTNGRPSCFIVAKYRGTSSAANETVLDYYYGRVLFFFEHSHNGKSSMLFAADWVTKGLKWGDQGQLYKKGFRSTAGFFQSVSVECVSIISHQIYPIEQSVEVGNRKERRTYIIDDMREFYRSENRKQRQSTDPVITILQGTG